MMKIKNTNNFKKIALAGVAEWIACWPVKLAVAASIPTQGTCLGYGPGRSPVGGVREATTQRCFSASLPL